LHDDLRAGDVFVATQVDLFLESGKAASASGDPFILKPGGSVYRAPRDIVDAIRNFEFAEREAFGVWQEKCALNWQAVSDPGTREALRGKGLVRDVPALEDCHLASGPLVGASNAFSEWLRRRERQFKALDMEAGGAMVAASERTDPKRMVVLRGISDFGDARKAEFDAIGGGVLRRYAMRNALDLLWSLLESESLVP
jgi:nucleoside phosphorylase